MSPQFKSKGFNTPIVDTKNVVSEPNLTTRSHILNKYKCTSSLKKADIIKHDLIIPIILYLMLDWIISNNSSFKLQFNRIHSNNLSSNSEEPIKFLQ